MKIPPPWKVRRETARIGRQIIRLPFLIAQKIYFRRWYDAVGSRKLVLTEGKVAFGKEVGVYLIFPTSGLLEGHIVVIDKMLVDGITPVVVSNLPLARDDKEKLLNKAGWVIERPNIGYDFGGYRDAIVRLAPQFKKLNYLWILNDSVWMVPQPTSWFQAARSCNVDFAGATSHYGIARKNLLEIQAVNWQFDRSQKKYHYQSYALGIGSRILKDRGFLKFWQKLEIRNAKNHTVRVGEIGFSRWIIKQGYTHRATWEIDKLKEELDALSDKELNYYLGNVVIHEDIRLKNVLDRLLQTAKRAEIIHFMLAAVSRQAGSYAISKYGNEKKNYHFVKRSASSNL